MATRLIMEKLDGNVFIILNRVCFNQNYTVFLTLAQQQEKQILMYSYLFQFYDQRLFYACKSIIGYYRLLKC